MKCCEWLCKGKQYAEYNVECSSCLVCWLIVENANREVVHDALCRQMNNSP